MVVSTPAAKEFCLRHANDTIAPKFELIPHAYHDILNESDNYRNSAMLKALNFLFNGKTDYQALYGHTEEDAHASSTDVQ